MRKHRHSDRDLPGNAALKHLKAGPQGSALRPAPAGTIETDTAVGLVLEARSQSQVEADQGRMTPKARPITCPEIAAAAYGSRAG